MPGETVKKEKQVIKDTAEAKLKDGGDLTELLQNEERPQYPELTPELEQSIREEAYKQGMKEGYEYGYNRGLTHGTAKGVDLKVIEDLFAKTE